MSAIRCLQLAPIKFGVTSVEMSVHLPSDIWATELDAGNCITTSEELLNIVHRQFLWVGNSAVWLKDQKFGRDVEQGRTIDLELSHRKIAGQSALRECR